MTPHEFRRRTHVAMKRQVELDGSPLKWIIDGVGRAFVWGDVPSLRECERRAVIAHGRHALTCYDDEVENAPFRVSDDITDGRAVLQNRCNREAVAHLRVGTTRAREAFGCHFTAARAAVGSKS